MWARLGPLAALCGLLAVARAGAERGPKDWHGRSIYFILVDRFAQSTGDDAWSCSGKRWCGGTILGIQRKLDYIQGMGFDAIWITPVVQQVHWEDEYNGTAYHGYWASDFSRVDPHFGTSDDLLNLRRACTRRGMLFMLDIVVNHVGPVHSLEEVQKLGAPLNDVGGAQFHQLGRGEHEDFEAYLRHPAKAQAPHCYPMYGPGCNMTEVREGWFGDLADLRQEHEGTRNFLLNWVKDMVRQYGLDGLRLDTALYLPLWFLEDLQKAAGVYVMGEVATQNMTFHSSFSPPLQGLLNFPVAGRVSDVFRSNGSLALLQDLLGQQAKGHYHDPHLLGNFVDNHDGPRFLHSQGAAQQVRNGLAWALLWHGLPIVYYGTEQKAVAGQADSRSSMWPHYGATAVYRFIAELHSLRERFGFSAGGRNAKEAARVLGASERLLAFGRGELLVLLSNEGAGGGSGEARLCLEPEGLPAPWDEACGRIQPALAANSSLSGSADCASGRLCLRSAGGAPAAFTVSRTWRTWLV